MAAGSRRSHHHGTPNGLAHFSNSGTVLAQIFRVLTGRRLPPGGRAADRPASGSMEHKVGRFGIPVAVQDESAWVVGEPTKVAVVLVLLVVTELDDHDWILSLPYASLSAEQPRFNDRVGEFAAHDTYRPLFRKGLVNRARSSSGRRWSLAEARKMEKRRKIDQANHRRCDDEEVLHAAVRVHPCGQKCSGHLGCIQGPNVSRRS